MNINEAKQGIKVEGFDMSNNPISGEITGIVKFAGVALIKTGNDRINVSQAYVKNLKEIK